MLKVCEWCNHEFDGYKNSRYCKNAHYKACEACGKDYLIRDMKRPGKSCSKACADVLMRRGGNFEKECLECGKTFFARRRNVKYCNDKHYRSCVICDKQFPISDNHALTVTCSKKCAAATINFDERNAKSVKTNLEKFAVENPSQVQAIKDKKAATTFKNYGVYNPSESIVIQERRKETLLKKYGVENAMFSEEIKQKLKETNIKRYGVENPWQSKIIKEKIKKSMLDRYGVENVFQLPEIQKKAAENSGVRISKVNKSWHKKIFDKTGVSFDYEVQFSGGYADLGFGDLLVDINPSFTHSSSDSFVHLTGRCKDGDSCVKKSHLPRAANYHQERALAAMRDGKTLLQFFDWFDEDIFLNIVEAKLRKSPLRIMARKTVLREIKQADANKFLRENHLLGAGNMQTFCLGLYYEDELVHVQTFGKPRFNKNYEWEAIRSCSKLGVQVLGGFSKCDKYFFNKFNPESMISYVDLSVSSGKTELAFPGWRVLRINKPDSVWVNFFELGEDYPNFINSSTARRVSADRLLGFDVGDKYPRFFENGEKVSNDFVLASEGFIEVFGAGTLVCVYSKE